MHQHKKLGQIFLNPNVIDKEIALLNFNNKTVLEIGPGDGRVTRKLLELVDKIYAVEMDSRFANLLSSTFSNYKNVEIINEDFLEYDAPKVDIVFGNLPYQLSSKIIAKMTHMNFDEAIVMVQEEFAQRMCAKPGDRNFSRLSFLCHYHFDVTYKFKIKRTAFLPVPKVDSAVVHIKSKRVRLDAELHNIISQLFNHRKKTIRKSLLVSSEILGITDEKAKLICEGLPFPKERIYKLKISEIIGVAKHIREGM